MAGCMRRVVATSAVLFALMFPFPPPAAAAAPWLLLVYGGGLVEPVIIADWYENHEFLLATSDPTSVPSTELAGRPYFSLALFWGPEWAGYAERGGSLAALRPEQANQRGRFHPAYGDRQAILVLTALPAPTVPPRQATRHAAGVPATPTSPMGGGTFARRADPLAAEVLLRHGIPAGPSEAPVGSGFTLGAHATLPIILRP